MYSLTRSIDPEYNLLSYCDEKSLLECDEKRTVLDSCPYELNELSGLSGLSGLNDLGYISFKEKAFQPKFYNLSKDWMDPSFSFSINSILKESDGEALLSTILLEKFTNIFSHLMIDFSTDCSDDPIDELIPSKYFAKCTDLNSTVCFNINVFIKYTMQEPSDGDPCKIKDASSICLEFLRMSDNVVQFGKIFSKISMHFAK